MTEEQKYLQWMEEYFCHEDGETIKEYVIETSNNGKLSCLWNAGPYGRLGMYVRNYMRNVHPEIDKDFPNYGDFENYSWELIQKLIKKWEIKTHCSTLESAEKEYNKLLKSMEE